MAGKAADESKPEAYSRRYVEDFDEPRTTLAACLNILRLSYMQWDPQPQPSQILPA